MPHLHLESLYAKFKAAAPQFETDAALAAARFPRVPLAPVPHLHTAGLTGWIEFFMPEIARHALPLASHDDADYQDGIGDGILLLIERLSPETAFPKKPIYDRRKGNVVDYMRKVFATVRKDHRERGHMGTSSLDQLMDRGEGSEPFEPVLAHTEYDDGELILDLDAALAALLFNHDSLAARLSYTALRKGTWAFPIYREWLDDTVEFDSLPVEPTADAILYGDAHTTRNMLKVPTDTPESRMTWSPLLRQARLVVTYAYDRTAGTVRKTSPITLKGGVKLVGQKLDLRSAFGFADDEDSQANDTTWAWDFGEREAPFTSRDDDAVIKTYVRTYAHYSGTVALHDRRATRHARLKTERVQASRRELERTTVAYAEYENRELIDQPDGDGDVIIDHQDVVGALYAPPSARGFETMYRTFLVQADYVRHIQWLATQKVGRIVVADVVPGKGLKDAKGTVIPFKWAADRACAFAPSAGDVAAMVSLITTECPNDAHAARFCQRQRQHLQLA